MKRFRKFGLAFGAMIVLAVPAGDAPAAGRHAPPERPRPHGTKAGRRQDPARAAAIQAALAEYRRLHPERGSRLRAPLRALSELWRSSGRTVSREGARLLGIHQAGDGIVVDLVIEEGKPLMVREGLKPMGLEPVVLPGSPARMRLLAPVPDLPRLSELDGVRSVSAPAGLRLTALSEGVAATAADIWQEFVPPEGLPLGRPVKVAVVDAGFAGHEALLGGDLPVAVETAVFCGAAAGDVNGCSPEGPTDHGTAVAEIVRDVAPEARLLLVTFNLSEDASVPGSTLDQALDFASAWGADVISLSAGTPFDNRDGESYLCGKAQTLARRGIVWAVSAGNEGDPCAHEHFAFRKSGLSAGLPYGAYQSFPRRSDPILNEIVLEPGELHLLALTWNAWKGAPTDDFDLFYVCDFGSGYSLVDVSEDAQCGLPGSIPLEVVGYFNNTGAPLRCAYGVVEYAPAACRHATSGVQFDTWSWLMDADTDLPGCADLEEATSSYTISHPADCGETLAVGAVCVHDGGLEPYSSRGPTLDGRVKPDLCAPDAVSTGTYGPSLACPADAGLADIGFAGTSASAPHVTGALALLYQRIGGAFTMEQCRRILQRRARDVTGDLTPDHQCGSGRLCLSAGGCN